jgi:GNAT superfamily N-acetyltransferase
MSPWWSTPGGSPSPARGEKLRTMTTIRALKRGDWDDWRALWGGYLAFYRAELPDVVSRSTFERLCDDRALFGLLALDDDGRGIGMANCVVHPTTWSRRPKCYLEDLFVAPSARGHDVGRALLEAVKEAAAGRGARQVYWHTQAYNGRARSLYDVVGRPTSFVVYEM